MYRVYTMAGLASGSMTDLSFTMLTLGVASVLALLLGVVGLYGVLSYLVAQRTREIGVRMALGAEPSSVLRLVLGRGLLLVAAGIALGTAVAVAASFAIPPELLPNVSARDPLTLIGTCALLTVVALAANYLPARRATRIDPLIALRTE